MKYYLSRISGGLFLIIVGLLIWLSNLGILHIAWQRDWPVLLIIIGLFELVKYIIGKK